MTDDLVGRLRALLVSRAVINGMARGPMGYASRAELDAVTQLRSEAVDALPTLLARIEALEAARPRMTEDQVREMLCYDADTIVQTMQEWGFCHAD